MFPRGAQRRVDPKRHRIAETQVVAPCGKTSVELPLCFLFRDCGGEISNRQNSSRSYFVVGCDGSALNYFLFDMCEICADFDDKKHEGQCKRNGSPVEIVSRTTTVYVDACGSQDHDHIAKGHRNVFFSVGEKVRVNSASICAQE